MPASTSNHYSAAGDTPTQNDLLAALSAEEFLRLAPHLELVELTAGRVLCEAQGHLSHAYFPTTSIIATLCDLQNGTSVDIAVTGHEGIVGTPIYMGGDTNAGRIVVRSNGNAYRLRAEPLRRDFERGGNLQHLLLRYAQALMTQMSRTAVCNSYHPIEQQLCRSLLACLDRMATNELEATHESIAHTLGVRRESVTTAAAKLQAAGVIRYFRGRITVLDLPMLQAHACECYAAIKAEFERLLPRSMFPGRSCRTTVPRTATCLHALTPSPSCPTPTASVRSTVSSRYAAIADPLLLCTNT